MSKPWCHYFLLFILTAGFASIAEGADDEEGRNYRRIAHPILEKYCESCHNAADKKAGINFDDYYYIPSVVRSGEMWRSAISLMESGDMPPPNSPQMSDADRDSLIYIIDHVLDNALMDPDPGSSMIRRLSLREYSYTIKDLLDVEFDAMAYFPKEGSGGEGFDNQSGVMFMTPLMMERYYMAADSIVRVLQKNPEKWDRIATTSYRPGVVRRLVNNIRSLFTDTNPYWTAPVDEARDIILPFATKTFRGFLSAEERTELLGFFEQIYFADLWKEKDGFDTALSTVIKRILVSPMFLYRSEINQPIHKPYEISNVELATRLSYFLWSSMPDDTLFDVAYREDLHDPSVLKREVLRMMNNEKFKRFSQSFAPQWLGVEESLIIPQADKELFPEFTADIRESMRREVVDYFDYIFSDRKNVLELLDSDFTLLNEPLANFYGIPGIKGEEFRKVDVDDYGRGGILGMGAVLTATSLPNRTSPVLRGQWVLEQVLGTPAPPPPPDVPELNEDQVGHDGLSFRKLLELHRASPSCAGCHNKMDPIGFAMENFDAVGRWRQYYKGEVNISTAATLENGVRVEGPTDLKHALADEKKKFAENFSRKVMSYALGRGITFTDSPTLKEVSNALLENEFNSEEMILAVVNSYPFRHRQSDVSELYLNE